MPTFCDFRFDGGRSTNIRQVTLLVLGQPYQCIEQFQNQGSNVGE